MDDDVLSGLPDLGPALDEEVDEEELALASEMKDFFVAFLKTVRSAQLYVQGNPLLHQFMEDLGSRLSVPRGLPAAAGASPAEAATTAESTAEAAAAPRRASPGPTAAAAAETTATAEAAPP